MYKPAESFAELKDWYIDVEKLSTLVEYHAFNGRTIRVAKISDGVDRMVIALKEEGGKIVLDRSRNGSINTKYIAVTLEELAQLLGSIGVGIEGRRQRELFQMAVREEAERRRFI
ncbi:hypothetical protein VK96_15710 [Bacillus cereus]|uniref:hypothetical protein n=1 Tax=Bacillus cereus TaxID=1396 RepID=UPI00065D94DA|nr:hypothetical protein [Bacillus cereus]KMN69544.1 hypothetical protein VK96_15710 [Bacillus cereus]